MYFRSITIVMGHIIMQYIYFIYNMNIFIYNIYNLYIIAYIYICGHFAKFFFVLCDEGQSCPQRSSIKINALTLFSTK